MNAFQPQNHFEKIRRQISDKLLLVGLVVSVPVAFASIHRMFSMEVKPLFVFDVIIALVLGVAYFTRSDKNYRVWMMILISYLFFLALVALYTFGLFSFGLVMLLFAIILFTTLFGIKYGFAASVAAFLFLLGFVLAIHLKFIEFNIDFNLLSASSYQWAIRLVMFTALMLIAVSTLGLVHNSFEVVNNNLAYSEARFNLALDSVNEVVWELDLVSKKTYVSSRFEEILHFAPSDLFVDYEHWKSVIHPDDQPLVFDAVKRHQQGLISGIQFEYRVKDKQGGWHWILTKGKIVERDNNGKATRVLGTHTDIGPRKEMESTLKSSELKYRSLFENANDAIVLVQDSDIVDVNHAACELFHMQRDEMLGVSFSDLCPEKQVDGVESDLELAAFFNVAEERNSVKREWEFMNAKGELLFVIMSISKIQFQEKAMFQVVLHNITERKRFEQSKLDAIIDTEEKERLKLSADLHDEVGPFLSSMNMYLSLLNRPQTANKAEILENMQEILASTISSVREISNNLSPHILNNHGLVLAIEHFIEQGGFTGKVEFEHNLGEVHLPRNLEVSCYRIVKELLNNSLKYAQAQHILIKMEMVGNALSLSYGDDGVGFDLESTLSNRQTGMGLLNILNRLKTLNASYDLRSKPGEGFAFEMKAIVALN